MRIDSIIETESAMTMCFSCDSSSCWFDCNNYLHLVGNVILVINHKKISSLLDYHSIVQVGSDNYLCVL